MKRFKEARDRGARYLLSQMHDDGSFGDDPSWATPLAWATRKGHDEIAELLKEHGATI